MVGVSIVSIDESNRYNRCQTSLKKYFRILTSTLTSLQISYLYISKLTDSKSNLMTFKSILKALKTFLDFLRHSENLLSTQMVSTSTLTASDSHGPPKRYDGLQTNNKM
jgi:hypothetical protein